MNLDFLGNLSVTPNTKKTSERPKKERNPVTADIRVFANGAVFPSAALTQKFNLEYNAEGTGNGFDVIDSRKLQNTSQSTPAFIMITPVQKSLPKVDMFARAITGADGLPSVLNQGATTFGKQLLDMAKEVYGIECTEGYVDFNVVESTQLQALLQAATNGIYYLPKAVSSGPRKGEQDFVRRQNLQIFVLTPAVAEASSTDIDDNSDAVYQQPATVEEQLVG